MMINSTKEIEVIFIKYSVHKLFLIGEEEQYEKLNTFDILKTMDGLTKKKLLKSS